MWLIPSDDENFSKKKMMMRSFGAWFWTSELWFWPGLVWASTCVVYIGNCHVGCVS